MTVDKANSVEVAAGASQTTGASSGHQAGTVPMRWSHLRTADVSAVLISRQGSLPTLAYWGPPLEDDDIVDLDLVTGRPLAPASLDAETPIGIVPESGSGFSGSPGLHGQRGDGGAFAPRFSNASVAIDGNGEDPQATWTAEDLVAELALAVVVSLGRDSGVLMVTVTVTNNGPDHYTVGHLAPSLPLPEVAQELLTLTGRWTLEFQSRRHRWEPGAWVGENRRGRTSHDRVPVLFAGSAGFSETEGRVWGVHLGWSGNSRVTAELLSDGRRHVQAGELLAGGEVILGPGQSYTGPTVYGAYSSHGLGPVSRAFHRFLRARAHHPGPDRPRPVTLNTWEAVYFNHDHDTLTALAAAAAEVGVERFVLDDGWFSGRDDDSSSLGDWTVDAEKYPNGLGPLIDHVRGLGMEFGLWVEPEMVNPASVLYRDHPEWALQDSRYPMVLGRNQLVLDLANPEAWSHIFDHLDRLLNQYEISYLKWDMNRDLVQPTHELLAGTRAQTMATYRLMDEVRRSHPGVEIESCSSGGARADFEVLARTERIWTSDCNDALDRQSIQRGFSLLFPPELMGAHIGPPISHTTGRNHGPGIRCGSAFLGHLGIEWNLLRADDAQRAEIADLIRLHKQQRPLLHDGDWYRLDHPDPAVSIMGVVSGDRSRAVFVYATVATRLASIPGPIRFAGLDPDRSYRVTNLTLPGPSRDRGATPPRWTETDRVVARGRVLMDAGLQPPVLDPESAMIVELAPA